MKIGRFEDLNAWKESRKLRKLVSDFTRTSQISKDYVFNNQIRSASLSVMSNIAEGFEATTDKEFANFLGFARRSCGEVRSQLYAALDDGYINRDDFSFISSQAISTGKLITGLISYLRKTQKTIRRQDHSTIRPYDHKTIRQ